MSEPRSVIRANMKNMIHDNDNDDPVFAGYYYDAAITRLMQSIGAELGLGMSWDTTTFPALAAAIFDYVLPAVGGLVEYDRIIVLRLRSQGRDLAKRSFYAMEALRTGTSVSTGDPTDYAIITDAGQGTTVRLFPTPDKVDAIDMLFSQVPATLVIDTDIVPFPQYGCRALEYLAAAELVGVADQESLARLKLSDNAVPTFAQAGSKLLHQAKCMLARERQVGQQSRWRW